jgi:hypothetical protein
MKRRSLTPCNTNMFIGCLLSLIGGRTLINVSGKQEAKESRKPKCGVVYLVSKKLQLLPKMQSPTTSVYKGIYNARCLEEMHRLINRFLVKH